MSKIGAFQLAIAQLIKKEGADRAWELVANETPPEIIARVNPSWLAPKDRVVASQRRQAREQLRANKPTAPPLPPQFFQAGAAKPAKRTEPKTGAPAHPPFFTKEGDSNGQRPD